MMKIMKYRLRHGNNLLHSVNNLCSQFNRHRHIFQVDGPAKQRFKNQSENSNQTKIIMENQAEYKTKERQFHEEYLQGRRPKQYEGSAIILGYTLGFIAATVIVFGLYKFGEFAIDFIKNWHWL